MFSTFLRFCVVFVGFGSLTIAVASQVHSVGGIAEYREVMDDFGDEVIRVDIYYLSWYGTLSPGPTKEDLPARAEIITSVRDSTSAKGLLYRIGRYVKSCSEPVSDLDGVRMKVDIVGASGSLLGSIISDGDLVRFEYSRPDEGFMIGCTTEMFRFIFSMGDPGFSGYAEAHLKLREVLSCEESRGRTD